tara:strand:- start:300 stop:458 length:159 start_codon:yes stop_codon:yes gene_type:complete
VVILVLVVEVLAKVLEAHRALPVLHQEQMVLVVEPVVDTPEVVQGPDLVVME